METIILSYRLMGRVSNQDMYRMTYDGNILGDDRGYTGIDAIKTAIRAKLDKDAADARRYDRPLLYVFVEPK